MSKRRIVKPGLWFAQTRAEIEVVTVRMKKTCEHCGDTPLRRRLKLTHGSGRHATGMVLCQECGDAWIVDFGVLVERAREYLREGPVESVRLPKE